MATMARSPSARKSLVAEAHFPIVSPSGGLETRIRLRGFTSPDPFVLDVLCDGVPVEGAVDAVVPAPGGADVTFLLPPGAPGGCHTLTFRDNTTGDVSAPVRLEYACPHISSLSHVASSGVGGTQSCFKIEGENFGASGEYTVLVDGTALPSSATTMTHGHKCIVAEIPASCPLETVSVRAGAVESLPFNTKPSGMQLFAISPCVVGEHDKDVRVTIEGLGLGDKPHALSIVAPDHDVEGSNVTVTHSNRTVTFTLAARPATAAPGEGITILVRKEGGQYVAAPGVVTFGTRVAPKPAPAPAAPSATSSMPAPPPRLTSPSIRLASPLAPLATSSPRLSLASPLSAPGSKGGHAQRASLASPLAGRVSLTPQGPGAASAVLLVDETEWSTNTTECQRCDKKFTLARRRHHCRVCGACVCSDCSPCTLRIDPGKSGVRACSKCFAQSECQAEAEELVERISLFHRKFGNEALRELVERLPTYQV